MPDRIDFIQVKREQGKRIYKYMKYPEIPLSINDIYVTTTIGDRLDLLADQFYENIEYWWIIATANPDVVRRDSYNLKPGIEIRIPSNYLDIVDEFEELNKEE
tara:strand:+ start:763 stop:1071 length:309 start_codon:yes stop_codon:yes gene_type:complete